MTNAVIHEDLLQPESTLPVQFARMWHGTLPCTNPRRFPREEHFMLQLTGETLSVDPRIRPDTLAFCQETGANFIESRRADCYAGRF